MSTWAIITIVEIALYVFMLGGIFGQWQERRWQLRMKRDRDELERTQREVDGLIAELHSPTFEWYDRVN